MKKMLLATGVLALLITGGCVWRRLLFKTTGSSSTKGNHHPSFLRFELVKKLSMQPKFVAAQKMLLKQKPSKHS